MSEYTLDSKDISFLNIVAGFVVSSPKRLEPIEDVIKRCTEAEQYHPEVISLAQTMIQTVRTFTGDVKAAVDQLHARSQMFDELKVAAVTLKNAKAGYDARRERLANDPSHLNAVIKRERAYIDDVMVKLGSAYEGRDWDFVDDLLANHKARRAAEG